MDGNNGSNKAKSTAVVVAILALVVGGGVGYLLGNSGSSDDTATTTSTQTNSETAAPTTDTAAADLRVALNNLETEHVSLAAAATRAGFDGDPSFPAAAAAVDKNSNEVADAIGSIYGDEARARFYEIWASHVGFFVDYTVAAKAGDTAGMEKAVTNLNGYVEAISTFLSEANPNLPKDAVAQLFTEHVGLLKDTVDNHGAGDFAASYASEDETRTQVTTIADALAVAVVKQNPDKF